MPRIKVHKPENKIIVSVNPKLYPLQALYGAAYVFLDRAYIYLDGDPKKEIYVSLKGKKKLGEREIKNLGDEFLNELLNYGLRYQISKDNRKIREYIVGAALVSVSGKGFEEEIASEKGEEKDWQKDPLGIAVPWEEKYGKKEKEKKRK